MEIFPKEYSGKEVMERLGKDVCCYFCQAQNASDEADTGWVKCPIKPDQPDEICLGCCIDIASTCRAERFESHHYWDIVEDAAKKSGRSVSEARLICLKHQEEVLVRQRQENPGYSYEEIDQQIKDRLAELSSA